MSTSAKTIKKPVKLKVLLELRRLFDENEAQVENAKFEKRWRDVPWLDGYGTGLLISARELERSANVHAEEFDDADRRLVVELLDMRRYHLQTEFDNALQCGKWSFLPGHDGMLKGVNFAIDLVNGKVAATAG